MDTIPKRRVGGREKQGRGWRLSMGPRIYLQRVAEVTLAGPVCDRSWEVPRVENQSPGTFQLGVGTVLANAGDGQLMLAKTQNST